MYGSPAIGLPYKDSMSGTPAGGIGRRITVQHGAIRVGSARIEAGATTVEVGVPANGTATTMDVGTLTAIATSRAALRHAVVAMYSDA